MRKGLSEKQLTWTIIFGVVFIVLATVVTGSTEHVIEMVLDRMIG